VATQGRSGAECTAIVATMRRTKPTIAIKLPPPDIALQPRCLTLFPSRNDGATDTMGRRKIQTDDIAVTNCLPAACRHGAAAKRRFEPPSCQMRLAWPPDPLTRLLMDADGVTEADFDALLRKVAAELDGR
jgi:hypothetical protein